jgi:nucleoside-diphosphate-sugar epimerase
MGGWNLLKAANQVDYSLFVNTGTSSEYGYKQKPMKETDLLEPASYYAVTKAAFTHLCGHVARSDKQHIVTLRPFAVYGPYEEPTRLVPTLMRALYFKEQMNLVSSTTARDFIYVDDMVEAYLRVDQMKRYPGEVFNIGTGRQETIKTLVKTAVEATGCSTEFHWGKMPARRWDTNRWVADIKKAQQCLDWQPRINLKDGLALMWAWYKENHRRYEK